MNKKRLGFEEEKESTNGRVDELIANQGKPWKKGFVIKSGSNTQSSPTENEESTSTKETLKGQAGDVDQMSILQENQEKADPQVNMKRLSHEDRKGSIKGRADELETNQWKSRGKGQGCSLRSSRGGKNDIKIEKDDPPEWMAIEEVLDEDDYPSEGKWDIKCRIEVSKMLKGKHFPLHLKEKFTAKIHMLAIGDWRPELAVRLKGLPKTKGIMLYEAKLDKKVRMLWDVQPVPVFSPRCSMDPKIRLRLGDKQGYYIGSIRIWNIVTKHEAVPHMIARIIGSYKESDSRKGLKGFKMDAMGFQIPNVDVKEQRRVTNSEATDGDTTMHNAAERPFDEEPTTKDWYDRGLDLYQKKSWLEAWKCFKESNDQTMMLKCSAHLQEVKASEKKADWEERRVGTSEEFLADYMKAASMYLDCGLADEAIICLKTLKEWAMAGDLCRKLARVSKIGESGASCSSGNFLTTIDISALLLFT